MLRSIISITSQIDKILKCYTIYYMNIYFSGPGGVGIGPLAEIAMDAGYDVIGSDIAEGLMTNELRSRGMEIHIGPPSDKFLQSCHDKKPIDWLVYTAALRDDHPELLLAKKLGIRISKRDGFLNHIVNDKKLKLIAVAGTHGKTSTTGMLVWTMKKLGIPISYFVGSTIPFGPTGKYDPKSEYFVIECDEFNKNFLNFKPYLSLVISIGYDHFDTYPTEAEYLDSFEKFIYDSNHVIGWSDQHEELYKNSPKAHLLGPGEVNNSIKLAGEHNRRNATLAQAGLKWLGFTQNTDNIISQFPGTDRRFEMIADNLYSDYAHHPVEIAATLQLASELSKNIVLVYQPHQNIRQHEVKDQYTNQFEKAKKIYWLPTHEPAGSRQNSNLPMLSPADLIANITNKKNIEIANFNDELWHRIQNERAAGSLVICMGAGKIDSWVRDKLKNSNQ